MGKKVRYCPEKTGTHMSWLDECVSVVDSEYHRMGRDCVEQSVLVAVHPGWPDNCGSWEGIFDSVLA